MEPSGASASPHSTAPSVVAETIDVPLGPGNGSLSPPSRGGSERGREGASASPDGIEPASRSQREQKVALRLERTCYRPEEPVSVTWTTNAEMDSEHDLRAWDFLAVHSAQVTCDQYDASAYMLKQETGTIEMCAPPEDGRYIVSVCRDFNIVRHAMLPARQKEFISMYGLSARSTDKEAVLPIGAVGFTVCSQQAEQRSR